MAKKIKFPFAIDISSWKGIINWKDVHPRPDLVICQASMGTNERDDLFSVHWENLKHLQIMRGAYHIFDSKSDSKTQISNYIETIEAAGGFDEKTISPILNVTNWHCNPKKNSLEKGIIECLEEMEKYTGRTPIILISRRYWRFLRNRNGKYPDWANDYFLWVPWYPTDPNLYRQPPLNTLPNGWKGWEIWKYDECAEISGIKGYVSLSTLSPSFAAQIGITSDNSNLSNQQYGKLKIEAKIIASEGIIVRRESLFNSKMLAFLAKDSQLLGEKVEFKNSYEAWLHVTNPVVGWCPIVHTGKIYLSINNVSHEIGNLLATVL
jgi:GH25 family lysozyme M1 (1,4-beta-N-acetylmuramidase)